MIFSLPAVSTCCCTGADGTSNTGLAQANFHDVTCFSSSNGVDRRVPSQVRMFAARSVASGSGWPVEGSAVHRRAMDWGLGGSIIRAVCASAAVFEGNDLLCLLGHAVTFVE